MDRACWTRAISPRLIVTASLLAGGCAPSGSVSVSRAPNAPRAHPVDGAFVTAVAADLPASFALDGDVREWPSLRPEGADRSSRVALAFGPSGLTVGARLVAGARHGAWLGIRFPGQVFPPVKDLSIAEVFGPVCRNPDDPPSTWPFEPEPCDDFERRYDVFQRDYQTRFERLFRLDPAGVATVQGGAITPLAAAKAAVRVEADVLTVEATLPLSELPRFGGASLSEVEVCAAAALGPSPVIEPAHWARKQLPTTLGPARFEAVLRSVTATVANRQPENRGALYAASYTLDDPMDVEIVGRTAERERVVLETRHVPLFRTLATLANVTVVEPFEGPLLVLKDGEVLRSLFVGGDITPVVREREVMLVSARRSTDSPTLVGDDVIVPPIEVAQWGATVVSADGSTADALLPHADNSFWLEVEMRHDPSYETLSLAGVRCPDAHYDRPARWEIEWRWDATTHKYRPTSKRIGPAPEKKPARLLIPAP